MKKIILFAILSGLLLTAGCGRSNETPKEEVKEEDGKEESQKEDEPETRAIQETKPADLSEADEVPITVYYLNDTKDEIINAKEIIYTLDIGQMMEKLAEYEVLPEGMTFVKMEVMEEDGIQELHLDMPAGFKEYLDGKSKEEKELLTQCFVDTILEAHGVGRIYITVEDEKWITRLDR